ncbi:hypothetical protein N7493_007387 [Penicillium malachiteum]|uniref:Cation-transporting P-type ATPase N-terminal domain-containing protein n=1 Tax=Penicillium malachiteum TaxID=1324776 RepID=A0AAD6HJF6_9EURO|nr:hypothetical protein N7493_007387 [Penicillium malachiteum]
MANSEPALCWKNGDEEAVDEILLVHGVIEWRNIEWHTLSTEEIQKRLDVDASLGISNASAKERLQKYGANKISLLSNPWFWRVFGYLFKGFGSILMPLGDPPAIANLALRIVLIAVFFIQAAFNAWQDFSSSRVMASITAVLPESCIALRGGSRVKISAVDLVPGDVLIIKAGNKIPADIRFIEASHDLSIDRSVVTGESKPIKGSTESTSDNHLETRCIGLQGTHCTSGNGLGIVVAEVFRFVALIFIIMVSWIVILAAVWGGWLHKVHPDYINVPTLIVDCVSVGIAYIPEGLPIAVTASLSITANIMKKNKVLCKSLKSVETLGSVTVICTDKTGTLTRNRMAFTDYAVHGAMFTLDSTGEHTAIKMNDPVLRQVQAVTGLCNEGQFDTESAHALLSERRIFVDATDQAILRFSESLGSVTELRKSWQTIFTVGFDSKNKFMIRVVKQPVPSDVVFTMKGAPDILISRCSQVLCPDGIVKSLTQADLATIKRLKDEWSSQGKRVIMLARKILKKDAMLAGPNSVEFGTQMLRQAGAGLTLVGMVGLVDPPRSEIPEVFRVLRQAQIRLSWFVTGDFGLTALAIARQCNIVTTNSIHDYPEIVFSRTTPNQKLRIVRELQSREEIVAMTGNGVNDAPALKAADIGISLSSGSDIAIEAADTVLLDSFAAIVETVRYGRVVFDNLKKTVAYLLPAGSWSEFWPVFCNLVSGIPQILSSFLMIIICCFTDCAAAVALAYETPEADVLFRPPRHPKKTRLVNWKLMFHAYAFIGMIETALSFTMAFWYLERNGIHLSDLWFKFGELPPNVTEDYYTARAMVQPNGTFNKQTQNLYLFPAIVFALGISVIWLYVPSLQVVLDTSGFSAEYYFLSAALGIGLLCLDEGRKAAVRRWPRGFLAKMAW